MIKPSVFFRGDKIKKFDNWGRHEIEGESTTDIWDEVKDKRCIVIGLKKRKSPYYKHAYIRYKGKFALIVYGYDTRRLVITINAFSKKRILEIYKDKSYDYIDKEFNEEMLVECI